MRTDGGADGKYIYMHLHKFQRQYLFCITFYLCSIYLLHIYTIYTKKMKGRQLNNQLTAGTTKNVSAIFKKNYNVN